MCTKIIKALHGFLIYAIISLKLAELCASVVYSGEIMNSKFSFLSLILWVTQFGLSLLFPICFFLMIAVWLQQRFGWGMWIMVVLGILGLLISISTAKSCIRSLRKAAEEASGNKKAPVAFNDHD